MSCSPVLLVASSATGVVVELSVAVTGQPGVARFHESRARASRGCRMDAETRNFWDQDCRPPVGQTRFARIGGPGRRHAMPSETETPIDGGSVRGCDGQRVYRWKRSGRGAPPSGRPSTPLPRVRGPLDQTDRGRLGRSPATVKAYFYDPPDANKGPSWEREVKAGGRELRSHLPAAAPRGEILPRRAFSALGLAVQHLR